MSSQPAPSAPPMPSPGPPVLEVQNLRVWFPITRGTFLGRHVGDVRAVDDVSFAVGPAETLGLVGESGSGKSTIGRAIVGLQEPTSGSVRVLGTEIRQSDPAALRAARGRMQMVFQDPYASLDPRMTVGEAIAEPLEIHGQGSRRERTERVRELLFLVGLEASHGRRYPNEFSGGQRQRVGIARALALAPALVVADEPVSALDVSVQAQVINLLLELKEKLKVAYLFIAHDLSVVSHVSDRVAVMYLGRIVEIATTTELRQHPLHPYTIALLSAAPVADPAIEATRRRIILRGEMPSPSAPPPGCRFQTRCWLRARVPDPDLCATIEPPTPTDGHGRTVSCHYPDLAAQSEERRIVTAAWGNTTATPPAQEGGEAGRASDPRAEGD